MKVLQTSRGGIVRFLCVRELTVSVLVFLFVFVPLSVLASQEQNATVNSGPENVSISSSDRETQKEVIVDDSTSIEVTGQSEENEKDKRGIDKLKDSKDDSDEESSDKPTDPITMSSTSLPQSSGIPKYTLKQLVPETDQMSGALVYRYPIAVPAGRNGMQPDMELTYSNQNMEEGSIFGAGWSLSIPSIERINRKGAEQLYSQNYFTSSLSGELISISGNEWGAKVDNGEFLKYTFSNNYWVVKNKNGTVYTFGSTASARQDNPSDSAKVFKWMLQEIRDTNGNYVKFEYYKDNGQIYPSKIVYTGNGTTDGIFEMVFSRESRSDSAKIYKAGFAVKSNYRINEIDVKTSGMLAHKYVLAYGNGANGARSRLSSIVELGYNDSNAITTLPATALTYQSQVTGWTENTSWSLPVYPSGITYSYSSSLEDRLIDFNGDGLMDIIASRNEVVGQNIVYITRFFKNTGNGWAEDASWSFPTYTNVSGTTSTVLLTPGERVVDINNDGLPDIIFSRDEYDQNSVLHHMPRFFINNGSGWTLDNSWSLPSLPNGYDIYFSGADPQVADFNGDGLADIMNTRLEGNTMTSRMYLNNGNSWVENTSWNFPVYPAGNTYYFSASLNDLLIDFNGDGLTDIISSRNEVVGQNIVYITRFFVNTGSGWTEDASWSFPTYTNVSGTTSTVLLTPGERVVDINNDGLPDIIHGRTEYDQNSVQHNVVRFFINNGSGWTQDTSWSFPATNIFLGVYEPQVVDISGDGLPDIINNTYNVNTTTSKMYINNGKKVDSLTHITNSKGGSTDVVYKCSTQYAQDGGLLNPNLPINLETVAKITNSDKLNSSFSQEYRYEGGKFHYAGPFDRKFAGFAKIIVTDDVGNKTISYYHQGNTTNSTQGEYDDHVSKIGKIYRTETTDAAGNIYSKAISKWDRSDLGNGRSFVKQIQQTNLTYDGNATHKDRAELYSYDNATGNLIQKRQVGEVSASDNGTYSDVAEDDDLVTTYTYATNAGAHILALPSNVIKANAYGEKITEDRYYYDWQSAGGVTKGNETRHESWIGGEDYAGTQKAYDDFGSVVITTDARGSDTFYDYDAFNLYPTLVTNPLGQTASYLYDYSSGQVKQMTDANGRVFQSIYDGLDRLIAEKQPDLTTPANLVSKTEYVYTDTSGAVSVQKKDYLSASAIVNSITYFDGLGRKIQERKQAEGTNYEVKDYAYNNLDLLQKASLPYFSAGIAKTTATATAALYTNYTYDPMYRIVTQVDAAGTISNLYDDWKMKVTDRNGKMKNLYKDVYGRLVRVDEYLAGVAYPTFYEYDGADNLTKITDAAGNVRHFTYNGLGLRWSAEDLHAPDDETYGVWYFDYDSNGNLTSSTNPNGQTVYREYDELNRVLAEDYAGEEGTEVIYEYDSGTNGIGRLRLIIARDYEQINNYNPLGNISSEIKTIGGEDYTTSYTYDRQGNILTLINPDNSAIKYTYGTGGLLNTVSRKESSSTAYSSVITNFDYSPTEQLTIMSYANGMKTTNVYSAAKLYRLSSKTTTIAGAVKGQSVAYTYDNNGNITKLVDSSATDSKKTVIYTYDDLNRLLSATATGVATGQSNYTEQYVYDIIGNIVSKTGQGTYEYNGNEGDSYANPHAVTNIDGVEFTYDKSGNLLTKGNELINTWNYDNRLIGDIAGDITNTHTYDVSGQRLTSSDGGATTIYANKYYNTNDGNATKHIFANNLEVAVITGTDSEAIVHYTATDHLTGSSLTTNPFNAKEELLDYLPFGTIRIDQKTGDYSDQRKFAGYEYDNDTGLSYANARYYDGGTGRFISQDPAYLLIGEKKKFEEKYERTLQMHLMNPQGLNSYSYVNNNPLKYTDPDGEILPFIAAAAAIGWAATEIALSAYDVYDAAKTVTNPNASWTDKGISVAGVGIGLIAPGGGYGKVGKEVSKIIPNINRNNLPSYAKNTLNVLEKNGFKNPIQGYKGGGIFRNDKSLLPIKNDPNYYKEWDVKPLQLGVNRGSERIVTGKNGEVYWTNTHYGDIKSGPAFQRIK